MGNSQGQRCCCQEQHQLKNDIQVTKSKSKNAIQEIPPMQPQLVPPVAEEQFPPPPRLEEQAEREGEGSKEALAASTEREMPEVPEENQDAPPALPELPVAPSMVTEPIAFNDEARQFTRNLTSPMLAASRDVSKEERKAEIKEMVKNFCVEASIGIECKVGLDNGTRLVPASFFLQDGSEVIRIVLAPEDISAAPSPEVIFKLVEVQALARGSEEILAVLPDFDKTRAASSVVIVPGQGKGDPIALCYDEALPSKKMYAVLKIC
eukprot:Cvel_3351.t1-p1 / transcript=Cvel_3351.t1 / gene=Cvel_3351 / organism=Chromera_velia_CCMP2878 / gene_product=hypothetical protein / transcript_product=hypothetical protein / location=Cvel_scaffold133:124853-128144(+) / protein_length=264 / sequence_SO=supercontig / SO=protein_coding / is_pseudo=false